MELTNPPDASIIIPVVRPHLIDSLISQIIATASCNNYEIIWKQDDNKIGCPKMVKQLVEYTSSNKVCFLGDDIIPIDGFLKIALNMMEDTDAWLVGLNDGVTGLATHWVADKKLLDHLENREFFYTGYIHTYCDNELMYHAKRLGKYVFCKGARIMHRHPLFNTAPVDEFYMKAYNRENMIHDEALFNERNGKFCKIIHTELKKE